MRTLAIISIAVVFISAGVSQIDSKYRPFVSLFKNDSISLKIKGLGGYQGECIEMKYTNSIEDSLYANLTPGTILVCDDSSMQDILITRQELLALNGKEKGTLTPWGYCCRANRGAPKKDVTFSNIKMGNDSLVRLANLLNRRKFSKAAEQNAIWAISDGNPIASIPEGQNKENMPLRRFVAKLLKQPIPWYTVDYHQDTVPFSNRPERVYGEITYHVNTSCLIDIIITDTEGNKLKAIRNGLPAQPGKYTVWVDEKDLFQADTDYFIRIYYDRAERKKWQISL